MKNINVTGNSLPAAEPLQICETPLSAQIADWLDSRGIYNDHLPCGKVQTAGGSPINLCKNGMPDRFAIVRGQIIFIEVKERDRKQAPDRQEKHLRQMNAGAIVLIADSFDQFVSEFNAYRAAIELREREMMRLLK